MSITSLMKPRFSLEKSIDACERALRLTGLGALSSDIASTDTVKLSDENLPFLSSHITGALAWKIGFTPVFLRLKSAIPGFQDWYQRNFVVFLEKKSGCLISIKSIYHGNPEDMRPEPSASSATRQLSEHAEIYSNFPNSDPHVSFIVGVDAVLTQGLGSPFQAKEIHAFYVTYSNRNIKKRPAWIVTLRGIPPLEIIGKPASIAEAEILKTIPTWKLNHSRNIVDAATGRCIFATNAPQPDA